MKSREQIQNDVMTALERLWKDKAKSVSPDKRLISEYGFESIDMLDLLFEIEQTTGISINLSQAFANQRKDQGQGRQFDLTVNEITEYIVKNQ